MTTEQKNEVRQYLIGKKLPVDLLMEVEDHFALQIENAMSKENLEFHEVFERVKSDWQDELKMKNNLFLNISAPNFVYKIMKESDKKNLQKSFLIVFLVQIITIFYGMNSFNKEYFNWFYLILILIFFIIRILIYAYNFRNWNLFNIKKETFQYSIYQRNLTIYSGVITYLIISINNNSQSSDKLFEFFHGQNLTSASSWILLITNFGMQFLLMYANINLFQHSKTVNHIKKYIVSLKTN